MGYGRPILEGRFGSKSPNDGSLWTKRASGAFLPDGPTIAHRFGSIRWTHPGMFALLDVPQNLWKSQNCNAANIGLNSQNARAMVKVIRPVCRSLLPHLIYGNPLTGQNVLMMLGMLDITQWFACSFEKNCIAPPGSSRANHRQDQAALGCFVYLAGYHCEHHGPIDTQQDDPNEQQ